jgi:hypothetical protein
MRHDWLSSPSSFGGLYTADGGQVISWPFGGQLVRSREARDDEIS